MLRVAKGTAQVAATEAHEDGRRTCVKAFALKGVEYFVDFVQVLFCLVGVSTGSTTLAFFCITKVPELVEGPI